MPVTSQPTDQPYGQVITDRAALERIFREHYTRLVEDARKRLGDSGAAAAPRVVSKAFHLAWQDRKRFHSMEELDAFLGAQIHHGAAREQSRLAGLHRMEAHGGAAKEKHEVHDMTVDEAWDRLVHTLEGGAPEAYRARASTARHEAAAHVKDLAKPRNWRLMVAVGVAGLLVASAVVWYIDRAGESRAIDHALAAGDVRAYETGAAQQMSVTLDDSTVVLLGPESKLSVPGKFGMRNGYRAVKIQGTAHFTVNQAGDKPFQVRTTEPKVALLANGTQFTVRKYLDDPSLIIHVEDGSVELRAGEQVKTLGKGMAQAVTNAGQLQAPTTDQLTEATAWVNGNVSISGRNLRYALTQLKRWYGLDVHVEDITLLARPVFLSAPLGSQREAVTSIEKSGGLKFTYVGQNMAFTDTAASRKR